MANIEVEVASQKIDIEIDPEDINTHSYLEDLKFARYFYLELSRADNETFLREMNLVKK